MNFPNRAKQIPAIPYFLFLLHAWYILGYKDQMAILDTLETRQGLVFITSIDSQHILDNQIIPYQW